MKVKDAMLGAPYYCQPDATLATAAELMSKANCGFLPVQLAEGIVISVITDRDICVSLGTRNRPAGEVTVAEAMSGDLYFCSPEDDIHLALQTMREANVRRLPVTAHNGMLVGVLSMDDILFRAKPVSSGKEPELSSDEVVRTFRSIVRRGVRGVMASRTVCSRIEIFQSNAS